MTAVGTTWETGRPLSALPGGRHCRMMATAASTSTTSIGGDASSLLNALAPACEQDIITFNHFKTSLQDEHKEVPRL